MSRSHAFVTPDVQKDVSSLMNGHREHFTYQTPRRIEVICGPMFSGKSEELIRRLKRAQYAKLTVSVYKPAIDRRTTNYIYSRTGYRMEARVVESSSELLDDFLAHPAEVVAIDEGQFFDDGLPFVVQQLVRHAWVLVAGLDMDFRGEPFGPMPQILAIADMVTKLAGVCMRCHSRDAIFTQRLIDGKPAPRNSPQILVGDRETYECRCRYCHEIN